MRDVAGSALSPRAGSETNSASPTAAMRHVVTEFRDIIFPLPGTDPTVKSSQTMKDGTPAGGNCLLSASLHGTLGCCPRLHAANRHWLREWARRCGLCCLGIAERRPTTRC